MDKLFSNIYENFSSYQNKTNQDVSNKTLLQNHQITQDKINNLLEQSTEALRCGPDCQKLKITEELKQKYLDAETNMLTAPIKLEQSKKNYYLYTEGNTYYDNIREEELKNKSEKISQLLEENFNNEVSNANIMNNYLNSALINSENSKELLKKYLEKNQELKLKLKERYGDILTNNRKTYYETDAIQRLESWYVFFWRIYYIIVLIIILAFIFYPRGLSIIMRIFLVFILIFYPYLINYIIKWVFSIYIWIKNKIPLNVYNNM